MKNEYLNLLKAILDNSRNLKDAAVVLLKASLSNQKLRPYAQFLLYTCIEECGKLLIVLDQYPKKISKRLLNRAGFSSHEAKIKRLVTNIQRYRSDMTRNDVKITKVIRNSLREPSIYVDFKNSKATPPQFVKNKQPLENLASLVINCIKFCEFRLSEFRKTK